MIIQSLDMIKEVKEGDPEEQDKKEEQNAIDTNHLVTQARLKRKQINIKAEEEEKKLKMIELS